EAGGGCERRVDGGAPHEHAEAIVAIEGAELHEQVVDVAADATAAVGLGEVQELSVQPDVQRCPRRYDRRGSTRAAGLGAVYPRPRRSSQPRLARPIPC